jgi:hypothetical protein
MGALTRCRICLYWIKGAGFAGAGGRRYRRSCGLRPRAAAPAAESCHRPRLPEVR